jgi:hypothetical protein
LPALTGHLASNRRRYRNRFPCGCLGGSNGGR